MTTLLLLLPFTVEGEARETQPTISQEIYWFEYEPPPIYKAYEIQSFSDKEIIELIIKYFKPELVDRAIATARCESSLNPNAVGDNGTSFGLWQIHLPAHPTVTKEQALNPEWSTKWASEKFAINPKIWSCYRILFL